jgi:hypothetical protein
MKDAMEKIIKEHFSGKQQHRLEWRRKMAKSEDLVKYITQQVVTYMDMPSDVRKQQRQERRTIRQKTPWIYRWFGMAPLWLRLWFKQKRQKRHH